MRTREHREHREQTEPRQQEVLSMKTLRELLEAVSGKRLGQSPTEAELEAALAPMLGVETEVPGFGRLKLVRKWGSYQVQSVGGQRARS